MLRPQHGIDKDESRAIRGQIRKVLMGVWDPIGVCGIPEAADEYDSYIGGFFDILIESRSRQEIIDKLIFLESEQMGLPHLRQRDPERYQAVAHALLSIPLPKRICE